MPSIRALVEGFQKGFDAQKHSARLYEAFIEVDRQLSAAVSSSASNRHYARIYSSAAINIPNNVATVIAFNKTRNQNGGLHSDTSQNTRMTIFRAGIYHISAHVQWPAAANGIRKLQIQQNGANIIASLSDISPAAAPPDMDQSVATGYHLEVGDYIEILGYQNSGGALNIPVVADYSPEAFIGEQ